MLVFEYETYGKSNQFSAIDEAIRTVQFIRNKAIRLWMDGQAKSRSDLNKYCAVLAKEFPFANQLNENAWGDSPSTSIGGSLSGQGGSGNQASPALTNRSRSVSFREPACGESV